MGLLTKLKSAVKDESSFFGIRRYKSKAHELKITRVLSELTVLSIPKAYTEEKPFNWLTNKLDSFEYIPSGTTRTATRRQNSDAQAKNDVVENEYLGPFCLFPCWGSPCHTEPKSVISKQSIAETSYSSGYSSERHGDKEGEVLVAKPSDDVSDITSAPSVDSSESSDEDDYSSCESDSEGMY